jgi:hypothetical protein
MYDYRTTPATAWLFIFGVGKVCGLFVQKIKEKCLAYTGHVMCTVAPVRAILTLDM